MSKLLDSLRQLVQRQITERGLVVWYDPEKAYERSVDRLDLGGVAVLKYSDGYFRLREALEAWLEWVDGDGLPLADKEVPPQVVVYIPLARQESRLAMVEAETAGVVIEPGAAVVERNTRLAGLVERIYAKIAPEKAAHVARQVEEGLLGFEEVEQMAEEAGSAATGALKLVFGQASPVEVILLFASSEERDSQIDAKKALPELAKLFEDELGLAVNGLETCAGLRNALLRHLLLGEMALALPKIERTGALEVVSLAEKEVQRETLNHICRTWRNRIDLQEAYASAAEKLEQDGNLSAFSYSGEGLQELETFPAMEPILLERAAKHLLEGDPKLAAALAVRRRSTFWSRRVPEIFLQWSLVETAADLLGDCAAIAAEIKKGKWSLGDLVSAYVGRSKPWMALDTKARHLESRWARFDLRGSETGPDWEKLMAKCRSNYLGTLDLSTEAYTQALEAAGFHCEGVPPQSQIFRDHVAPAVRSGKKTAYLLVDALRYEMAVEMVDVLGGDFTVETSPVMGQLPGITPVGMAALMPQAENGMALEKHGGKLVVAVAGNRLPDRAARLQWLKDKSGEDTASLKLGDVVRLTPKKKEALASTRLLVVTSQEIDRLGEGENGDEEARIYMEDVLEKLRRGIRNLATLGFDDIIVTADHGFIFAEGFETGLKMDAPGGETLELHARCWVGNGGKNADGFFRVAASGLELGGDLECALPRGLGTFKNKAGAKAYFHGGASLQEQILPVVRLNRKAAKGKNAATALQVQMPRNKITNRFFSVTLSLEAQEMFEPEPKLVALELLVGREIAGHAAVASYGFEEGTKEVCVRPGEPNSVTLMLSMSPPPEKVSLRVIDSKSGNPLATLKDIPVNLAL